jgi:hypothetical protein
LQKGVDDVGEDDDEWEPVEPIIGVSGYWGLCTKKPILIGNPVMPPSGGGSVLTQHQSHDTETDNQRYTSDGSSGRPGAQLQIWYFTGEFAVHNILQYYFVTGEDNELPGSIPAIHLLYWAEKCDLKDLHSPKQYP